MIRVWCEHLPLEELQRPSTLTLLATEGVHPIIAVRPETSARALADVVTAGRARGLDVGIWPLLSRADGYWPSERNIETWAAAVTTWIEELDVRSALPAWLAVDLEPPLSQASRLLRRTLDVPIVAARFGMENMDIDRYRAAERALSQCVADISRRGVKTLGITLPLAAHDLRDDTPFWQDMFETPWADIGWDAAGIMAYGSIVSGASRGLLSPTDARAIHQRLLERVAGRYGTRAHASIGVTGSGIFGDEPSWSDPEELHLDACAALASGIEDIGVFCLEGILARDNPETWLRAVTNARSIVPPSTWKATASRHAGAALRRSARYWFGR